MALYDAYDRFEVRQSFESTNLNEGTSVSIPQGTIGTISFVDGNEENEDLTVYVVSFDLGEDDDGIPLEEVTLEFYGNQIDSFLQYLEPEEEDF